MVLAPWLSSGVAWFCNHCGNVNLRFVGTGTADTDLKTQHIIGAVMCYATFVACFCKTMLRRLQPQHALSPESKLMHDVSVPVNKVIAIQ